MDETLICPYCGQEQYGHEPDEITAFMCKLPERRKEELK